MAFCFQTNAVVLCFTVQIIPDVVLICLALNLTYSLIADKTECFRLIDLLSKTKPHCLYISFAFLLGQFLVAVLHLHLKKCYSVSFRSLSFLHGKICEF